MANIGEWIKGITFFLFTTIMFYFLWQNIFLNIINFVGTDMFGIGVEGITSFSILKTMAWVSFIFLYIAVSPLYMIFAIMSGSKNDVETKPLSLLKAIGLWAVLMPFLTIIYGIINFLVEALNGADLIDAGMETTASGFSWIFALIVIVVLTIVPFVFVLEGYGYEVLSKRKEVKEVTE